MAFQSGVPLPGSVWQDYQVGTSLAGDIGRLIGGGLRHIGGVQRQQDKEAKDRAFREAEAKRQGDQFQKTLDQNEAHFQLGREDKYRLEAIKNAQSNGWELDDNGEPVWTGNAAPIDYTPPRYSVPEAKAAGASYQSYDVTAEDVARAGGFDAIAKSNERFRLGAPGPTPADRPKPTTALAGSRTPPLAVVKASAAAKERIVDNRRADEQLGVSKENLALSKAAADRVAAKERDEAADFQLSDDVARGMYDTPPFFAPDVRRDKDGKPAPVYKTSAGAEYAARAFSKQQAEQEKEVGAQNALIAILDGYKGKIPQDSPYARHLVTHGPDGKPLPSKQLETQRRELERNLDDQVRGEVRAARVSQIEARRTARDAAVQAAAMGKATIEQIKAEAQLVEREIETMLDTTDPFARAKLTTDPTFKALTDSRERLAASLQKAIGANAPKPAAAPTAAPTVGAPPALKKAVSALPATFQSKAAATQWFLENSAGLSDDERAFLESKVVQKIVR